MTCESCRAPLPDGELFCPACGCKIRRLEPGSKLHAQATAAARYDRVERDPAYARVLTHRPATTDIAGIVIIAMMFLIGLVPTVYAFTGRGLAVGTHLFMFCFGLAILGFLTTLLVRLIRYQRTPVHCQIAVVLSEREERVTTPRNTHTYHHATLQTRDGAQLELLCSGGVHDRIAAPDIGVAFIKADTLVDFIRFRD